MNSAEGATRIRRCRLLQNMNPTTRRVRRIKPPITPPAIAPVFVRDFVAPAPGSLFDCVSDGKDVAASGAAVKGVDWNGEVGCNVDSSGVLKLERVSEVSLDEKVVELMADTSVLVSVVSVDCGTAPEVVEAMAVDDDGVGGGGGGEVSIPKFEEVEEGLSVPKGGEVSELGGVDSKNNFGQDKVHSRTH